MPAGSNRVAGMARMAKENSESGGERKRGKGRPSGAEAAVGRNRILELTAEFLKTHPVSELSTVNIAKVAGVDPALVRYYFGSKNGLLAELISKSTGERTALSLRYLSDAGTVDKKLKQRVRSVLQANVDSPYYHEVMVARIFNAEDDAARAILNDLAQRGLYLAEKFMADGERSGELRAVDPAFFHMLVVGACSFFVTGRPLQEAMRGRKVNDRTLDAFAEFFVDVVLNGLKPRP